MVDGPRYAAFVVAEGEEPAVALEFFAGVAHQDGESGELEHLEIVVIVTDGHDFSRGVAAVGGPAFEGVSLGAALVEDVDDAEVTGVVLGSEYGELLGEIAVEQLFCAADMRGMLPQNIAWMGSSVTASSSGVTNSMYSAFFSIQR